MMNAAWISARTRRSACGSGPPFSITNGCIRSSEMSRSCADRAADSPPRRVQPSFGEAHGDVMRRDALRFRFGEDLRDVLVELAHAFGDPLDVIDASDFAGDANYAAGIDGEIGDVEDAARVQPVGIGEVLQLVVGRTRDDRDAQRGNAARVQHRAERARRKHIRLHRQDILWRAGRSTEFHYCPLHPRSIDITDDQPRASAVQMRAQMPADMTEALYCDAHARYAVTLESLRHCAGHAVKDTLRRCRRGVAAGMSAMRETGNMAGGLAHMLHVLHIHPDIFRRGIGPAETFDRPPEGTHQRRRLDRARITDDHRLAAAEIKACDRVLTGHAMRQPQYVRDCSVFALVVPEATSTRSRT